MASPTFLNETHNTGTGTTFTMTEPTSTASGTVMIMALALEAGFTSPTGLSGWTQEYAIDATAYTLFIYSIRRGGSAPNLTFSWTNSHYYDYSLCSYNGCVSSGNYIEARAQSSVTNGTTADPPAVTTVTNDTLIVACASNWAGWATGATAPSGYTLAVGPTGYDECQIYKAITGGAGTSQDPGSITANGASADQTVSVTFVLASVAGGLVGFIPQNNELPRRSYSFPAKHLQQATGFASMLRTPPIHEANPAVRGWQPPPNRETTDQPLAARLYFPQIEAQQPLRTSQQPPNRATANEARPGLAAAQAAAVADASYPIPERLPPLRVLGAEALLAISYVPQVEASQPSPRPFALPRWALGGVDGLPQDQYRAVAEANPAIRGWQAPPVRHLAGEPLSVTTYTPEVEAYPALRGWQAPPLRHLSGEPVPTTSYGPEVEAYPTTYGWRPGPNRERGAETPPPVVTPPMGDTSFAASGWRSSNNQPANATAAWTTLGAAALVPAADANNPIPERYPPLRMGSVDPLASVRALPQIPETWPYTKAAPPKRDWQGFEPQPAPQLIPFFAWVGMTSPAWRPPLRAFPYLSGAEAVPRVSYTPASEAPPAVFGWRPGPNRERGAEVAPPIVYGPVGDAFPAQFGWRPGPNRERGADVAPPTFYGWAPQLALVPTRATHAAMSAFCDAFTSLPQPWAAHNDWWIQPARRTRSLEQPQTLPASSLKPWGYEPAPPRQPRALIARGNNGEPFGGVTIYVLRPWIWEPAPLWGRRERSKALDTPSGGVLFGFATAHGPLNVVAFANQLPTLTLAGFANQLPTVTLVGFENQLAEFIVLGFDDNE